MGKFNFGSDEVKNSFKVFFWSFGSAAVALLISLTGLLELPPEYAFLGAIVNTVLYSLSQWIKDNRSEN